MINTVIFDMDGVIIDSEPLHMQAEQEVFRSLGLTITPEKHNTFVGTSTRNMWELLIREFGIMVPIEELIALNKKTYRRILDTGAIGPMPGVTGLVKELHRNNVKLAVASSSTPDDIEHVLTMFSLRDFFPVVVSGAQVRFSKPHPEIFLKTAEVLGVDVTNCVVIEDSSNGVNAARAAGMKCVGFINPNSGNQDLSGADRLIYSLSEINTDILRAM